MNLQNQSLKLKEANKYRSLFLGLLIIVSLSQFLTAILLFSKNERVVIVPAHLTGKAALESNSVSASYLEDMAAYYAHLIFDITPSNVGFHHRLILDHISPEAYGGFKEKLLKESTRVAKDALSTAFSVTNIQTDTANNTAIIKGYLSAYVGGDQVQHQKKKYIFYFNYKRGRLLIEKFKEATI